MALFEMGFGNDGDINIVVNQLNRELIQSIRLSDGVGVKDVEVGRRRYSYSTHVCISKSNPRWVYYTRHLHRRSPSNASTRGGGTFDNTLNALVDEVGVCGRWITDGCAGRLPEITEQPVPSITVYVGAESRCRLPPLQPRLRTLVIIGMFIKRTRLLGAEGGCAHRRLSSWSRE